jgi:hypothetical protein
VTKSKQRNTNRKNKSESRRGRPSKAEKERILGEQGAVIAKEFRGDPLRAPVDPQFMPYYEQILNGNVAAIARYCDAITRKSDISSSFCELLGRLVTMRFYRVADMILRDVERRRVIYASDQRDYLCWNEKLKPLCRRARGFIRSTRKSGRTLTRQDLWSDYLNENAGQQEGRCQEEKRRQAIDGLIQWSESARKVRWSDIPQKRSLLEQVNEFAIYGLVPKEVFFDLALSKNSSRGFSLTPAQVARRYASRIAGISESTASHKDVRK